MAYWNPFGWDEDTRRSIQSIVRPVMQVASMAASMGAFSGGGGAAKTGTGVQSPTTGTGTLDEALTGQSGIHEWTTDMPLDAPKTFTPDQSLITPDGRMEFDPNPGIGDSVSGVKQLPETNVDFHMTPGAVEGANQGFGENFGIDPNATGLGGPNSGLPIQVEPYQEGQIVGEADFAKAMENQPEIQQRMTEMNKATEGMSYDEKLKMVQEGKMPTGTQQPTTTTRQVVNEGAATSTPDKPEIKPKPKPKDGPGPGGKEEPSSWAEVFDKGFNWENIEKFLKSKEGRHWLLMDEKGFAGIGRKLTAAADAGTTGFTALTPKERKKILDRLKKEREERKKKRRNR